MNTKSHFFKILMNLRIIVPCPNCQSAEDIGIDVEEKEYCLICGSVWNEDGTHSPTGWIWNLPDFIQRKISNHYETLIRAGYRQGKKDTIELIREVQKQKHNG